MSRGLFVTGTDTGVGKTVVTAGLVGALRKEGYNIGVMKPFQSGAYEENNKLLSPDLDFILNVVDLDIDYDLMNPVCLKLPLAPFVAAQLEGLDIDLKKVEAAYNSLLKYYQGLIVEGAGGLLVPLAKDFWIPELIKLMDLPIIIVSRPNLGTINHTLLTIEMARKLGIEVLGVIINGLDESQIGLAEKTNPAIIEKTGKVAILGIIPYKEKLDKNTLIDLIIDKADLSSIKKTLISSKQGGL